MTKLVRQSVLGQLQKHSRRISGSENVKKEPIPKAGRINFQGAIFDMSMLLRIERIFGRWQTLYIVGAS